MFKNKNNSKRIIFCITVSYLIFFPAMHRAQEERIPQTKLCSDYDFFKGAAQCYGTYLAGSLAHELGHLIVGKKIYKCNGMFWITPTGIGATYLYYNPTREFLSALRTNKGHIIKHPSIAHPSVCVAGPLFGIGFALLAPILNTFYHEYKQDRSPIGALKRTARQPYINDKQNLGLLFGAHLSLASDMLQFSPFIRGSDGHALVERFNLDFHLLELGKAKLKLGLLATYAITTGTALLLIGKTVQKKQLPHITHHEE